MKELVGNSITINDEEKEIWCTGGPTPVKMLAVIENSCKVKYSACLPEIDTSSLKDEDPEIIRRALSAIVLTEQPGRGIKLMREYHLLEYIIPEMIDLWGLYQGHSHIYDAFMHIMAVLDKSTRYDFTDSNLVFRLSCLLHDIGKRAVVKVDDSGNPHFYDHHKVGGVMSNDILTRLKYDGGVVKRVSNLVTHHMDPIFLTSGGEITRKGASRLLRAMNIEGYNDIGLLIALSSCDIETTACPSPTYLDRLKNKLFECEATLPFQESPLTGNEIMSELGIGPGEEVGIIKDELIDRVVEEKLEYGNHKKALEEAHKIYEEMHK